MKRSTQALSSGFHIASKSAPIFKVSSIRVKINLPMNTSLNKSLKLSLKPGSTLEVSEFHGDPIILERMHELGLRNGTQIKFVRQAPFGGPYLFQLATTLLALREEELACLKFKTQN